LVEKYFDGDLSAPETFLGPDRLRILDAGCGAGVSALLLFGDALAQHEYIGVDISESVAEARKNFADRGLPATFVQANLGSLPEELGTFDVIFSEGVLHHTDSVRDSLLFLASRLNPGGRIAFYVYARKAPIREFTDDMVRNAISGLSDEEAWDALMPLTELGKALGDLGITIEVPADIPILSIERGTYDLQRLFFYKICKAYYQTDYTLDEMNHINFDWFRPRNCHRHSVEEVIGFCQQADLGISRLHAGESGITVIARKEPRDGQPERPVTPS
jgi:SAM-dependent methyltransferase